MDNVNTLVNRRDIGKLYQAFQRAIIQQHDYDMDFRIKRTDGQERYIKCEGRCETDHEGDVIALYGIMQDVTEQVIYEQELRNAKESAEAAYASKSRFLANMSHELRTPLNAIIGFSEMMQHQLLGPLGNPKYLDYVGGIHESGQHLLDLITDILDMSKIEAGKYELDVEDVNIAKSIALTLHMMEGRALDGKVSLKTGSNLKELGEDGAPQIQADRRAVMQILLNLMSNAVKFTPEGGSVTADCTVQKKAIKITVTDTGVGIPANKLANVLMPFEQAAHEHTRDHEGSGLGLSITKELAELHGGSIKIDSAVGEGTSVTVTLPFKPQKKAKN
jgi:two-component system cell cycle sensor histidine kinase PleC